MTAMTVLKRLKTRLEIKNDEQNEMLCELLRDARDYILSYTRRKNKQWKTEFNSTQIKIAAIEYGRLGAEGVQAKREGDVSTTFYGDKDYPDSITKALDTFRLIKGL